jgi:hypothetical protein
MTGVAFLPVHLPRDVSSSRDENPPVTVFDPVGTAIRLRQIIHRASLATGDGDVLLAALRLVEDGAARGVWK